FVVAELELDKSLAQTELGLAVEERIDDTRTADANAVGAAEVADAPAVGLGAQLEVPARDGVIAQRQIGARMSADERRGDVAELEPFAHVRSADDGQGGATHRQ